MPKNPGNHARSAARRGQLHDASAAARSRRRGVAIEYVFTLKCQLADDDRDLDALVERLGEAGCDDAMVGIGQPGRLALEFTREAESADAAMCSALADARRAAPSAKLIEAAPDWVDLTDVAEIVNVSRQNIRKLMLSHPDSFPAPNWA